MALELPIGCSGVILSKKIQKNFDKPVDFLEILLYNSGACKICDEVRCGYNLWNNRVGGNSYGVCRGLDQGGKLFKLINNT